MKLSKPASKEEYEEALAQVREKRAEWPWIGCTITPERERRFALRQVKFNRRSKIAKANYAKQRAKWEKLKAAGKLPKPPVKHLSEEHKRKISESKKGVKRSEKGLTLMPNEAAHLKVEPNDFGRYELTKEQKLLLWRFRKSEWNRTVLTPRIAAEYAAQERFIARLNLPPGT